MTWLIKRRPEDYLFTLVAGSLYIYAVSLSVITSTIIKVSPGWLFLTGLGMLLFFMLLFLNRITLTLSAVMVALAGIFIFLTRENWDKQWEYIQELLLLARGYLPYKDEYGPVLVVLVCAVISLFTAVFLFHRFLFYPLALGGTATFVINWIMDYRRDDRAFLIFLFCFCLLLTRKTNHSLNRSGRSSFNALLALPLCAAAVWVAGLIPGQEAPSAGDALSQLLDKPIAAVSEFFYLTFNPKYFSFQTTGFTDSNDRLGGPVVVNTREVMSVEAPRRVYLSGVTKNTYTGRAWTDTLAEGDLYADAHDASRIEFLETAAALMRYASFYRQGYSSFSEYPDLLGLLTGLFPAEDQSHLTEKMFPCLMSLTDASLRIDFDVNGNPIFDNSWLSGLNFRNFMPDTGFIYTYMPVEALRVSIGANRTGTVFRPAKGWGFAFEENGRDDEWPLVVSAAGDIKTQDLMARDTVYRYQYLQTDSRLLFMKEILNMARHGYYNEVRAALDRPDESNATDKMDSLYSQYIYLEDRFGDDNFNQEASLDLNGITQDEFIQIFVKTINNFMGDTLAEYADKVYAHYTKLPETLPQRVYDLAWELVEGCETDYARVKALENYIVQFPYTLAPSPVPEEADFVDYFLFDGKEGYCTYYASALAVLCRCVGIPSRFAEGYLLPPTPGTDGAYVVTNKQAHSWAEVYLEGYGWLTVEATAPYSYGTETRPVTAAANIFTPSFQQDPRYAEHLNNFGFDNRALAPTAPAAVQTPSVLSETAKISVVLLGWLRILIFIVAGVGLLFIYILAQEIREGWRHKKTARYPVNEQAQAYFKGLLRMTNYYHYPFLDGETPHAYGQRLGKRFAFKSDTIFLRELIALYYKAKYGAKPLSVTELALMRDCFFEMGSFMRSMRIWPHYIYLRYIRKVTLL